MTDYSSMTNEQLVEIKNRMRDGTLTKEEAQALVSEFRRRAQVAFREAEELKAVRKSRRRLRIVGGEKP